MIITVANQKGGVAKTTTALTLGHGLARLGKRVLVVDLDPQGHVAFGLGLEKRPGIYRLIVDEDPEVIERARPGLDIIPSDKRAEKLKRYMATLDFPAEALATALEPFREAYDAIIIDTAPSLDILHVGALWASELVLVVTKLDAMAIDGVSEIVKSIIEVTQRGRQLDWRVVPTFFDKVTNETRLQLKDLVGAFGGRVWPPIPQDVRVREASAERKTLWEYAPRSAAVLGYTNGGGKTVGGYADLLMRVMELL